MIPKLSNEYINSFIGKVFNNRVVLQFSHEKLGKDHSSYFYKIECLKCKKIALRTINNMKVSGCYCNRRLDYGESAVNQLFACYRSQAVIRDLSFELDKTNFKKLLESPCYYCQNDKSNKLKLRHYTYEYNGIDRVDSTKGYTLTNTVTSCKVCNYAKKDFSQDEFLRMGLKLAIGVIGRSLNAKWKLKPLPIILTEKENNNG